MTTTQLKDMANYLKKIVNAEGSPAAKWTIPGLLMKVDQLESSCKIFDEMPSESTAKECNELRRQVEQIIVMVLRNVAENC